MRGPIRWAQTCGAQNCGEAPLTHAAHSRSFGSAFFNSRTASEGRLCSPRAAGRGKHASALSRRAIAPESCQPPRARKKTEGGGAPKGACHPLSALSQTSIRSMRTRPPRGRAPNGARSPSGASPRTRHASRNQHWLSPRPCFPDPAPAGVTRLRLSQSSALRADRSFCRTNGVQGRPGADCKSARGHRIPLRFQVCLAKATLG